jgi:hypothetical protein
MHDPRGFKKLTHALKYMDKMLSASKTLATGGAKREIKVWEGVPYKLHMYYNCGYLAIVDFIDKQKIERCSPEWFSAFHKPRLKAHQSLETDYVPLSAVWDVIGNREELFSHRRASFA